jgi:hypothetical protein
VRFFPPEQHRALRAAVVAEIAERPNTPRRHRSYPRRVKRARHNSYRVKRPTDVGVKHQRAPVPVLIPAA